MEIKTQFNITLKTNDGVEFHFNVIADSETGAKEKLSNYLQEVINQLKYEG